MIYLEPGFIQRLSAAFQNTQHMFQVVDKNTGYFNLVLPTRSNDGQGELFPETLGGPSPRFECVKPF